MRAVGKRSSQNASIFKNYTARYFLDSPCKLLKKKICEKKDVASLRDIQLGTCGLDAEPFIAASTVLTPILHLNFSISEISKVISGPNGLSYFPRRP